MTANSKKWATFGFFLIILNWGSSQTMLDSSKFVVLGDATLEVQEIHIIDSLLVNTIDYYNSRVSRGYYQISLSEPDYAQFLYYDSLKTLMDPFLKKNGKVRKRKLKKLDQEEYESTDSILNARTDIYEELSRLKIIGKPNHSDSIISTWGAANTIDLTTYYRQYQVYSESGNWVLVHCLCQDIMDILSRTPNYDEESWRNGLIEVHDGGSCFFKAVVFIDKREIKYVQVNGNR